MKAKDIQTGIKVGRGVLGILTDFADKLPLPGKIKRFLKWGRSKQYWNETNQIPTGGISKHGPR